MQMNESESEQSEIMKPFKVEKTTRNKPKNIRKSKKLELSSDEDYDDEDNSQKYT